MLELLEQHDFDREEWSELVKIDDEMEPMTRILLCEFSRLFDSRGQSTTKPKLLAKTVGMSVSDVRKCLTAAKDRGWLETVDIDGRKGYRASMPN